MVYILDLYIIIYIILHVIFHIQVEHLGSFGNAPSTSSILQAWPFLVAFTFNNTATRHIVYTLTGKSTAKRTEQVKQFYQIWNIYHNERFTYLIYHETRSKGREYFLWTRSYGEALDSPCRHSYQGTSRFWRWIWEGFLPVWHVRKTIPCGLLYKNCLCQTRSKQTAH